VIEPDALLRGALTDAVGEARARGHLAVGPAHVVIALLRHVDSSFLSVLAGRPLEHARVIAAIERRLPAGGRHGGRQSIPLDANVSEVLEHARADAAADNATELTVVHLLGAISGGGRGVAAQVLRGFGLTAGVVRERGAKVTVGKAESTPAAKPPRPQAATTPAPAPGAARRTRPAPAQSPTPAPAPAKFTFRLDAESGRTLHEQIVDQVLEATATRKLTPGTRIPSVRNLASTLGIAPGTVARAYADLESSGVVVTDGARGTTVAERTIPPRASSAGAESDPELDALMKSAVVRAFHMGAAEAEVRDSLTRNLNVIYRG
jgi:GntR family transcriptional regulator